VSLATEQEQGLAREEEEERVDEYKTIDVDDHDEDDEMDDDGPPPPLPVRDYEDDQEDVKTKDLLIDLTDECDLEKAEGDCGQITAKESVLNDVNNSSSAQSNNPSQLESPDLQSDAEVELVTDIVTDIDKEVEVTDIVTDFNNKVEVHDIFTNIKNEGEMTDIDDIVYDNSEKEVTDIVNEVKVADMVTLNDDEKDIIDITVTDIDNEVEVTDILTTIDNEVEVADIESVNDNEEIPSCPIISETVSKGKTEDGLQNGMNEKDLVLSYDEIPQEQPVDLLTSELEDPAARSNDVENLDIDLADPAVEAAATKIQSAFKGYKTRKNIGNNSQ